jgi:hypothetical protein
MMNPQWAPKSLKAYKYYFVVIRNLIPRIVLLLRWQKITHWLPLIPPSTAPAISTTLLGNVDAFQKSGLIRVHTSRNYTTKGS